MSAPLSSALILSYSSIAAWRPRSGLEPDPRPRVTVGADVQGHVGGALLERLQVGVDPDELDALDLRLDHAVDGVDAGAADADHANDRRADARRLAVDVRARPGVGVRGSGAVGALVAARGASSTFSGMSDEKAWRRRSRGLGTGERCGFSSASSAASSAPSRAAAVAGSGARSALASAARSRGSSPSGSSGGARRPSPAPPPRCAGRARPGGPRACSLAYRLPFSRTSSAS